MGVGIVSFDPNAPPRLNIGILSERHIIEYLFTKFVKLVKRFDWLRL